MSDLNLTHRIAEESADRLLLETNVARLFVGLGVLVVFGGPLLGFGSWSLRREGIGFVPGWILVVLGLPLLLGAVAVARRMGRRERIQIDRREGRLRVEGPRPQQLSFAEITGIQTRRRGPGIYRLLVESHGRAPLELCNGPAAPLNRLGFDLAAWVGARHQRG